MIAFRHACALLCGIALSTVPAVWHDSFGQNALVPPSPAPQGELRVTTDTPEYCASLARRIEREQNARAMRAPLPPNAGTNPPVAAEPHPEEVATLTFEGRRMCDKGLVVGGIARLRHAWMLLHAGQ